MKKLLFLLVIFTFLFPLFFVNKIYAQETQRVYFKVKELSRLNLINSYIHHEFSDQTFSIEAPTQLIEKLKKNPNLEFKGEVNLWKISRDIIPEIPGIPEIPNLETISKRGTTSKTCNPTSQIPWGITKVNGGSGGSGITVAVLDTGIKTDHPDLKNNIVDCVDAQYSSLRKRCNDNNGHGTHVAGTVAANGKILGVAPQAKIAAIQVCSNSGYCYSDDVARGIKYAADKGYRVINVSLGGSSMASVEKDAIDYATNKGSLIVAAAGNSGPNIGTINYPAAYYKVVAVGAIDSNNNVASFSSRGINPGNTPYFVEEKEVEFAAPGVSVESTAKNGCYAIYSGTSMATPHVAGLAAKVWQGGSESTRNFLHDRARLLDLNAPGDDPASGFGLPTAP